jgi:hypothetical protein
MDWKRYVCERLPDLGLDPEREIEIVEGSDKESCIR